MQQEAPNIFRSTLLDHGKTYGRITDLELMHNGDAFHIDDLLNFSNEEIAGPIGENDHITNYWANGGSANSDFLALHGNSFSNTDYHCDSDFFVPFDELAEEVEWNVSNFAEDSFSMENSKCTQLSSQNLGNGGRANLSSQSLGNGGRANLVEMSSISCVPARARSKRSRAARDVSNWYSLHSGSLLGNKGSGSSARNVRKKLQVSKTKLKSSSSNSGEEAETTKRRRCMHCGTERTPQWRAGPMGSKSLCNACGVRYKSGRLLPEYRPAASPSFTPALHSNSHKNVLHIRHLKYIAPRS